MSEHGGFITEFIDWMNTKHGTTATECYFVLFYFNFTLNFCDILLLITTKIQLNPSMDLFMFIGKYISGIGMAWKSTHI